MGVGSGLFSKTMFSTHLELRCTDAGSLGNWYTAACSAKIESYIKPELQTFKRPRSARNLQDHASEPQQAVKFWIYDVQPPCCTFVMYFYTYTSYTFKVFFPTLLKSRGGKFYNPLCRTPLFVSFQKPNKCIFTQTFLCFIY